MSESSTMSIDILEICQQRLNKPAKTDTLSLLLFIVTYNAHLQLKTLKWRRTIVMEEA